MSEKSKEGKITQGKLNYEIDWDFITLLAERMQKGKEKYEPYSWQKHTEIESLKQALLRHVLEIMKDNYLDDGQRYGHIAAATANLMMIHFQLKAQETEGDTQFLVLRQLVRETPNDQLLGFAIRELVK